MEGRTSSEFVNKNHKAGTFLESMNCIDKIIKILIIVTYNLFRYYFHVFILMTFLAHDVAITLKFSLESSSNIDTWFVLTMTIS